MQTTLSFVTLFLSLVIGPQPVEVAVTGSVARVEFLLDGAVVAQRTEPPWRVSVDFGSDPRPHRLAAVAFDGEGAESARAELLVNVPRPAAEAGLVLIRDDRQRPKGVRCFWEHAAGAHPVNLRVLRDGELLSAGPDGTFALPDNDERSPHVVRVEVLLEDGDVVSTAMVYGGGSSGTASAEVTAVPVVSKRRPKEAVLEEVLRAIGHPVNVVAVEELPAAVFLVQDVKAVEALNRRHHSTIGGISKSTQVDWARARAKGARSGDAVIHFVTVPEDRDGTKVFRRGKALDLREKPLEALAFVAPDQSLAAPEGQQFVEAASVAALHAAGSGLPRTVVLIVGPESADGGDFSASQFLDLAARLRVPVEVWTVGVDSQDNVWGYHAHQVDRLGSIRNETERLFRDIHDQWIVWIEGQWLPDEITVAEGASKLALAGAE